MKPPAGRRDGQCHDDDVVLADRQADCRFWGGPNVCVDELQKILTLID